MGDTSNKNYLLDAYNLLKVDILKVGYYEYDLKSTNDKNKLSKQIKDKKFSLA